MFETTAVETMLRKLAAAGGGGLFIEGVKPQNIAESSLRCSHNHCMGVTCTMPSGERRAKQVLVVGSLWVALDHHGDALPTCSADVEGALAPAPTQEEGTW